MSYLGVCSLSSFSNCAVVISVISFAGFDILFLFRLLFMKIKTINMEKCTTALKDFGEAIQQLK